jgi:hypothetical protein
VNQSYANLLLHMTEVRLPLCLRMSMHMEATRVSGCESARRDAPPQVTPATLADASQAGADAHLPPLPRTRAWC